MANKALTDEQTKVIHDVLGNVGRLIHGSKSTYRLHNPKNVAIFNANIVAEGYGKVWYGDIDLTLEEGKLISLASALKTKIHLLYEMDGRFEHENKPRVDLAVYSTDGYKHALGDKYKNYMFRDAKGHLQLKG